LANRQPANLAIGNLKFGVWNFSLARGRGHTRPTGGSGRFAAPPANFRAASRVAESLRGRIASRSAWNGIFPASRTRPLSSERAPSDTLAPPKSKWI